MSDGAGEQESLPLEGMQDQEHWWAGRDVDVVLYKINRRDPPRGPSILPRLEDPLEHLDRVLAAGLTVRTRGKGSSRIWRVGNRAVDFSQGKMTGIIGWGQSVEALREVWDEEANAWVDRRLQDHHFAAAPFAFTREKRFLGVLRHPTFTHENLSAVFSGLLNMAEMRLFHGATDWDVEPVGDEQEFFDWVDTMDSVTSVELTFKRPNPGGDEAFQALFDRLDSLEASQIREIIRARDELAGLNKEALRRDAVSRSFIAAAMAAYGFLVGKGSLGGKRRKYDQRKQMAREVVEGVPASWEGAREAVLQAVERALARRRSHG